VRYSRERLCCLLLGSGVRAFGLQLVNRGLLAFGREQLDDQNWDEKCSWGRRIDAG
jgi:hypothetical protein